MTCRKAPSQGEGARAEPCCERGAALGFMTTGFVSLCSQRALLHSLPSRAPLRSYSSPERHRGAGRNRPREQVPLTRRCPLGALSQTVGFLRSSAEKGLMDRAALGDPGAEAGLVLRPPCCPRARRPGSLENLPLCSL